MLVTISCAIFYHLPAFHDLRGPCRSVGRLPHVSNEPSTIKIRCGVLIWRPETCLTEVAPERRPMEVRRAHMAPFLEWRLAMNVCEATYERVVVLLNKENNMAALSSPCNASRLN